MIYFRVMIGAHLVLTLELLILNKSLTGAIEVPFKMELKLISKKVLTWDITDSMDVSVLINHPPVIIKDNLTTLHEEIMVEEAHMILPITMDTTLTLLVVNATVIVVSGVVMALQMIHMVQALKAPHQLEWVEDVDKTVKIDTLILNKAW